MRFFLGKDTGGIVRDKLVFAGDDTKADSLITTYLAAHPGWTAQEVDNPTFDAALIVIDPIVPRTDAVNLLLASTTPESKFVRAVLLVILDEVNVIRAAISLPPRTVAQLKTAVQSKINSGASD